MVTLTFADIAKYRSAFSSQDDALFVLDVIEDCAGDLEDAAISLALKVGQEPSTSGNWLEGLAKRWRTTLCQTSFLTALDREDYGVALSLLLEYTLLSSTLALPVMIYVDQSGSQQFCEPLKEQLNPNGYTS
ncbi:MAG: hypothetical protein AAGD25_26960 [Cyanobacteria bacterium P01_F01_bin.150]